MKETGREVSLDAMRVLFSIGVIGIHVSAWHWYTEDRAGFNWKVLNAYDEFASPSVLAFLMISGAVWLCRNEINIKSVIIHNIKNITSSYFFWSAIYAILHGVIIPLEHGTAINWEGVFKQWIMGRYHLWYCWMFVVVLMCLPVFHAIFQVRYARNCFLFISYLTVWVIPTLETYSAEWLKQLIGKMNLPFSAQYAFYFMAGGVFWLSDLGGSIRGLIYAAGIWGTVGRIINDTLNVALIVRPFDPFRVIAGFILFKYLFKRAGEGVLSNPTRCLIHELSDLTFGVYLTHDLILFLIDRHLFTTVSFNPVLAVPCVWILVAFFSFLFVWSISRLIPKMKKHII